MLDQKHPVIRYSAELQQLCEPLHRINITAFSHLRVFDDHQLTVLCNKPDFFLNYLEKKYHTADPCVEVQSETTDIGEYIVWDTLPCRGKTHEMLLDSAQFNFKHVFTLIKKQRNYTDFYHFGTHDTNLLIYQTYINNLNVLEQFIKYFNVNVEGASYLSNAYKIILNQRSTYAHDNFVSQDMLCKDKTKEQTILELINPEANLFTAKELTCIDLFLQGYSNKELAVILNLSSRTIEDKIDRLKIKMRAKSRVDLAIKLYELLK